MVMPLIQFPSKCIRVQLVETKNEEVSLMNVGPYCVKMSKIVSELLAKPAQIRLDWS
jgi:hypothetical protein